MGCLRELLSSGYLIWITGGIHVIQFLCFFPPVNLLSPAAQGRNGEVSAKNSKGNFFSSLTQSNQGLVLQNLLEELIHGIYQHLPFFVVCFNWVGAGGSDGEGIHPA